jgi:hypothetical protein
VRRSDEEEETGFVREAVEASLSSLASEIATLAIEELKKVPLIWPIGREEVVE